MPASVSASSVERISFDRSGFLSGHVQRRFGALIGLGSVNTMRTSSGPSSGDQGRACARCHSTIHASAAAFTSWRHGLTFFDDSIIRPPPTWRLLPCGAGDPWTVSVTVTDGLWGASASTALAAAPPSPPAPAPASPVRAPTHRKDGG